MSNNNKQKLELTWIGKNNPEYDIANIEPRILEENPGLSNCSNDPNTENMIIHGDNLLALKALLPEYEGKVKCIYIDPPYNTGNAFEHYDDSVEHSTWLSLMKPRLELLKMLLKDDGIIFIQIDDNEQAYLKILLDEVFDRNNFINCLSVTMSNLSGPKIKHARTGKRFPKIKEYILIYSKNFNAYKLQIPKASKLKWDKEYNLIIPEITLDIYDQINELIEEQKIDELNFLFSKFNLVSLNEYIKNNEIKDVDKWLVSNAYRICGSKPNSSLAKRVKDLDLPTQILFYTKNASGDLKLIRTDYNKDTDTPRLELLFAEEMQSVYFGDIWLDIATTGGIAQEGKVSFPRSKKPEKLVSRIIESASVKGDFVLDSFLGSGTTSAVAHKMGRKHIGIEMGDHAYTHCKVRLDAVISGVDQSGISKTVEWKGGGAYKFYELAPSFVVIDEFGNPVIDDFYNDTKLIRAMCKLLNYTFKPSQTEYWKHGVGQGKNYIYITTQILSVGIVEQIKSHLKDNESLVICPRKFEAGCENVDNRIMIKKIPQSVLKACHFGKKEYLLPIKEKAMEEVDTEEEEDSE